MIHLSLRGCKLVHYPSLKVIFNFEDKLYYSSQCVKDILSMKNNMHYSPSVWETELYALFSF